MLEGLGLGNGALPVFVRAAYPLFGGCGRTLRPVRRRAERGPSGRVIGAGVCRANPH
ncbi:MAG: hypothetical protein Ct9H300mP12_11350 [Acidimicrobiales bacterium]|nr:MAG: hypothetical protein Ct9H300mP12_11350 [Acidimicrobiales bacterium]